jgi:hypothetical protein
MGGGQVSEAPMIHVDIFYDDGANELTARVASDTGIPELVALDPALAFDPAAAWSVLNGKSYNYQYGWNVGGVFAMPAGAAIWIERLGGSPDLEIYDGRGTKGSYAPIFGTAGSPRTWKWTGVMTHNTFAILDPASGSLFEDFHLYVGDANTGSRDGFAAVDDAVVRLEWRTTVVEDPVKLRFGARTEPEPAPLCFLNANDLATNSERVIACRSINAGPCAGLFACDVRLIAVPATSANGGPADSHAAPGSCLELQFEQLAGPPGSRLEFWEPGNPSPAFGMTAGESAGTHRIVVSENQGGAGTDPYGDIRGRRFTVDRPGLYCLGFRLIDSSTNGPAGGPIHSRSDRYGVYFQAGLTMASLEKSEHTVVVAFGGTPGNTFYLERTPGLGSNRAWEPVGSPLCGTNRIQRLVDPFPPVANAFYRLRSEPSP